MTTGAAAEPKHLPKWDVGMTGRYSVSIVVPFFWMPVITAVGRVGRRATMALHATFLVFRTLDVAAWIRA